MAENKAAVISCVLLVVLAGVGLFAPLIAPFDPNFVNPANRLEGPSSEYWFGTDDLGRDIFSRVIYGSRVSMLVSIAVMIGATTIGGLLGLITGFYPRIDVPDAVDGRDGGIPEHPAGDRDHGGVRCGDRERDHRAVAGLCAKRRAAGAQHDIDEQSGIVRGVRSRDRNA
jgi:hypothetical protein